MATLALAAVGAAAGSALLPTGISFLGATLTGASIGAQVGAMAGSFVDHALFAPSGQTKALTGPRLTDLSVTASTEGAPLPRLYGRARLGGQVIWATPFEEEIVRTREAGGSSKGGQSNRAGESTEYRYYANVAVALCEGEIGGIDRVWADGRELDLSSITWRLYLGDEAQEPDSLILAREGAGNAPAYRGTAYIVLERMPLADYGNRLPQLSFEVYRPVDKLNGQIRAVTIIPGAGEFAYSPSAVTRIAGGGSSVSENVHSLQGDADWSVSLDQLERSLPAVAAVSLVVSWFGSDLRAGHCRLEPKVEIAEKSTSPETWRVAGLLRAGAHTVSLHDGRPAYGGTPSDASVVAAIRDLTARGLSVTLTPFILMDIPDGNALPDPWTGAATQPSYPWRGRITVTPAPGQSGSPDKSAAAATEIAALIGTAAVADFSIAGDEVIYTGPAEWTLRRMVLHYAHLAKAAGGIDAFVLGSELRSLTQIRASATSYPVVTALVQLAADVRAVLGPATKIIYAADWSEYFGHQPADGSGDVLFHLDPLWASANIDAIGVDLYWPLADWRDGEDHLDRAAGITSPYELAYLKANLHGGEGFDWYYASPADRAAQVRTPITDGLGKPWVFRFKDLKSWWLNAHYNRMGAVEQGSPTAWVPQSKPIWITEVGCPAVDKGANQPNVFVDGKSAESALPYFSSGRRDDLAQRSYLRAIHEAFDPDDPGYVAGANPTSSVFAGRMIDLGRIHVYAWDARPFPAFPANEATWGDAANWRLGHWLNGRAASAPVADVVARLLGDYAFTDHDVGTLPGVVPGFVVDRIMPAREALQPLELAYFFDSFEAGGRVAFRSRGVAIPVATLTPDELVEASPDQPLLDLVRAQETELPASAKISHIAAANDYRQAVAEARRTTRASARTATADLPIVLESDQAQEIAESWLYEAWAARERATFSLPPSRLAIEPSDTLSLGLGSRSERLRVTGISDGGAREIEARSIEPSVYVPPEAPFRSARLPASPIVGQPLGVFLDLPLLRGDETPEAGYVIATQSPWPGPIAYFRSPEVSGFELKARALVPATTGVTTTPLPSGPLARWDRATRLGVRLDNGELVSRSPLQVLGGGNALAIEGADGVWEVIQFEAATLVDTSTYELTGLLRGQAGSERAMAEPLAPGARVVLIDAALSPVDMTGADIGLAFNWRFGPASRSLGDASYAAAVHAFRGEGLRPLCVAHVRGARTTGDLTITWVRRTRIGGDSWEAVEVPLGETEERYEVDILSGASVVRTIAATSPSATYPLAEQIADFGAAQIAVNVNVYQLGPTYGRGSPRAAVV